MDTSQNKNTRLIKATVMICVLIFSSLGAQSQGDLMIFPRRVIFEGSKQSQELHLTNTGKDTANYVISIVQIRMKEDGNFETITEPDPGQQFADPYLRFFPRNVELAPNETQVVKIQLTNTGKLTDGEYRSHVYFRAVPLQKPLGEAEAAMDTTNISVKITPIFGITIPVIIRVGQSTAKVELNSLTFQMLNDTTPLLNLTFKRSGNMSVYGDLSVIYVSPQGKEIQVGTVKGIAVYTPGNIRQVKLVLDKKQGVNYQAGTLRVVYSAQPDAKGTKQAEAELMLD